MFIASWLFKIQNKWLLQIKKEMTDYSNSLWGAPSSLVNWCEEDYVHFNFIAETWNTLSNLVTILYGVVLLVHYKKYQVETRFIAATSLMILVGVGSASFHGTLKYHFQLLDELPMLYLTCSLSYIVIQMPSKCRPHPYLPNLAIFMCFVLTVLHVLFKDAELFFAAFGILLAPAFIYPFKHRTIGPFELAMKFSAVCMFSGFICWETDRFLCKYTHFLYLHSWWHVFTAISGVYWLNAMVFLRKRYVLKEPCRLTYGGLWAELDSK